MRILPLLILFLAYSCSPPNSQTPISTSVELASVSYEEAKSSHQISTVPKIASNRYITGAAYLDVTLLNWTQTAGQVQLLARIRWDASWRDAENYDAAWIFSKIQDTEGRWHHASVIAESYRLQESRTEENTQPAFELPEDQTGVFIYRAEQSQGDNDWTVSMALEVPEAISVQALKCLGLEMVLVPTAAFELGTLKSISERREVLTPGAGGAPYNPFFTYAQAEKDKYGGVYSVDSEQAIDIGPAEGNLFWIDAKIRGANTFSGRPEGRLENTFPKGYQGFYQMKYELSQAQYCDFLNTLSPLQQQARSIVNETEYQRPIQDYRNAIVLRDGIYETDRPHRPCNFVSWLDGQAYADWAGLRHMTELEFEKACRGPEPAVYREYVWGANEMSKSANMQFSTTLYANTGELASAELGEEFTDGNVHANMFSYFNIDDVCVPGAPFYDPKCDGCRGISGGDGGRGPLRMGIFGSSSEGDRIRAGATYYGAMDMGGNLQEPVVTVGHPNGRRFAGSHGDGELDKNGQATNTDWQTIDDEYAFGGRGGCWQFHENHARTADRFKGLRTKPNRRASHIGFRGVRTQEGS
ncbi:MAG: SUMF1/EgtB/PvdO family nonheme iron enzyme [Bacteroidota bacterium]